jgi:methyl-accepting chemotaxis protein
MQREPEHKGEVDHTVAQGPIPPATNSREHTNQGAGALLQHHLALDQAIDDQLKAVIGDTETSAIALIGQVRALSDSAAALLGYLTKSGVSALSMEDEIAGSVSAITQISRFVQVLPLIREGAENIQSAAMKEIDGLKSFTAVITDISQQTRFMALNIAIVAATSGDAGRAFSVVAREMRTLAERSASAVNMIEDGLAAAQRTMREGLILSKMDEQLTEAKAILGSLRKVEETYQDVRQYYKTLFGVVVKQNTDLATQIAEMLGNIQYQDVVRQRIERIASAMARRNDLLKALPLELAEPNGDVTELGLRMLEVLDQYLADEQRHKTGASGDADGLPDIELF